MTQELKPCPFCGGMAELKEYRPSYEDPTEHWVQCTLCYAQTGAGVLGPPFDSDLRWNTRALPRQAEWLPIVEAAVAWYNAYPDEQKVMRAGGYLYDTIKKHLPNPPEVTK